MMNGPKEPIFPAQMEMLCDPTSLPSDHLCSSAARAIKFPSEIPKDCLFRKWETVPEVIETSVYLHVTQSSVQFLGGMLFAEGSDFLLDCLPFSKADSYVCRDDTGDECVMEEYRGALDGWHLQVFSFSRQNHHLWRCFYLPAEDLMKKYKRLCLERDGGTRKPTPVEVPLAISNRKMYDIVRRLDLSELEEASQILRQSLACVKYWRVLIRRIHALYYGVRKIQCFVRRVFRKRKCDVQRMLAQWNKVELKLGGGASSTTLQHKMIVIQLIWARRCVVFRQKYKMWSVQTRLKQAKGAKSSPNKENKNKDVASTESLTMTWLIPLGNLMEVSSSLMMQELEDAINE